MQMRLFQEILSKLPAQANVSDLQRVLAADYPDVAARLVKQLEVKRG